MKTLENDHKKVHADNQLAQTQLQEIYSSVCAIRGPLESELNEALVSMNVKRQAYHSHSFIGNHCSKILANHDKLTCTLKDHPDTQVKYKNRFSKLAHIFSFMESRFLGDDEIDDLRRSCWEFG